MVSSLHTARLYGGHFKSIRGHVSDKFTVQDSGILNRLVPGDEVMAYSSNLVFYAQSASMAHWGSLMALGEKVAYTIDDFGTLYHFFNVKPWHVRFYKGISYSNRSFRQAGLVRRFPAPSRHLPLRWAQPTIITTTNNDSLHCHT